MTNKEEIAALKTRIEALELALHRTNESLNLVSDRSVQRQERTSGLFGSIGGSW